jgi:predicted transcriptional regulator
VLRERGDSRATLKVGVASYKEMKARTMAVTRGKRRVTADKPKLWFISTESFAKVLSAGNRELLGVIAEKAPGSLDELARITGKAKSNLSRTRATMGPAAEEGIAARFRGARPEGRTLRVCGEINESKRPD